MLKIDGGKWLDSRQVKISWSTSQLKHVAFGGNLVKSKLLGNLPDPHFPWWILFIYVPIKNWQ